MAKVVKAVRKAVKKAKPKATKKKVDKKPKNENLITSRQVYDIIAETLQNCSEGEFDLPSFLVRYLEKSHPSYHLGLHREFFIPEGESVSFYPPDSERAEQIFHNQASIVMAAFGEGISVKHKVFDLSLCKDCR